MKSKILSLVLCVSLLLVPISLPSSSQAETASSSKGQVIVTSLSSPICTFSKQGLTDSDDDIHVEESWDFGSSGNALPDLTLIQSKDTDVIISLVSSDVYSTDELMTLLKDNADVLTVEPNAKITTESITNDTYVDKQWALNEKGMNVASAMKATKKSTPVVAIVDTGVDYTHEDLASRMWVNPFDSSKLQGRYGYDFGDTDTDPMDIDGHGTHCAGTISGVQNNQKGIAGISSAKIMALKVFDANGGATNFSTIDAFNYIYKAQTLGVNVVAVNCSWGGGSSPTSFTAAINACGSKGALFSFASGNDGNDVTSANKTPYGINSSYTVVTGATSYGNTPASYSCYSKTNVDLYAPGTQILSSYYLPVFLPENFNANEMNQYVTYSDTADTNANIDNYSTSSSYIEHMPNIDSFGDSSGSYKVTVLEKNCNLYLRLNGYNISSNATYCISYMLGLKEGNSIVWNHYSTVLSGSRILAFGDYALISMLSVKQSACSEFYLDDVYLSNANPTLEHFGKYEYCNGTSMAAPMTSGAIALLAQLYPKENPLQRKAHLMTCVTKNASFTNRCKTGGYLNLSKVGSYRAPTKATSVSIITPAKKVAVKKSLSLKSIVRPLDITNSGVTWKVSNPAYCSISSTGKLTAKVKGSGKTVTVTATSKATPSISKSIKISIKKALVTKVKMNKKKITLRAGHKKKLVAKATPTYAVNRKVKWYSSKKKYATVTQKGVILARYAGRGKKVKIYARAKDGSKKKAYCTVSIR